MDGFWLTWRSVATRNRSDKTVVVSQRVMDQQVMDQRVMDQRVAYGLVLGSAL